MAVDFATAQANTHKVWDLLQNKQPRDPVWAQALTDAFLDGAFHCNTDQPFFHGPDGLTYFGFFLPSAGASLFHPRSRMGDILHWVAGAALLDPAGEPLYIFSPGDIVSMQIYGTCLRIWGGKWNEPPDIKAYSEGGLGWSGPPNDVMLPPLAARSLEFFLRGVFPRSELLSDREPSVCLFRIAPIDQPELPSELAINVSEAELAGTGLSMNGFLRNTGHHLPWNIAQRLISSPGAEWKEFVSLASIVKAAGLELAPSR